MLQPPLTTTTPSRQNEILLSPPPPSTPPSPLTLDEGGEGMEWHSDGAEGEFTVLFSVDDIKDDQVHLRLSIINSQSIKLSYPR